MQAEFIAFLHTIFGPDIDWKQVLLIGMSPVFLLAFAFEYVYQTRVKNRKDDFFWKDILANLGLGAAYQGAEVLAFMLVTGSVYFWCYSHRFFSIELTAYTAVPIFVMVEFFYYWFHRGSHRIRWFWTAHVAHHAGEKMNFTTAMRQSVLNAVIGSFVFFLPLAFLGVHPGVIGFMYAVNLCYQYFIHTNLIDKMPGWFEYIFNTPSHHRVHHGKNPQYIDKNYGGTLIIFDRLFGTFEPEVEAPRYGIVRQVKSYNPLVLNFHELIDMLKDAFTPGSFKDRLKHLWGPPEWTRDGSDPATHEVFGNHK